MARTTITWSAAPGHTSTWTSGSWSEVFTRWCRGRSPRGAGAAVEQSPLAPIADNPGRGAAARLIAEVRGCIILHLRSCQPDKYVRRGGAVRGFAAGAARCLARHLREGHTVRIDQTLPEIGERLRGLAVHGDLEVHGKPARGRLEDHVKAIAHCQVLDVDAA